MQWRWRRRACLLALVLLGLGWGGAAPAAAATLSSTTTFDTSSLAGGGAGAMGGVGAAGAPAAGAAYGMGLGGVGAPAPGAGYGVGAPAPGAGYGMGLGGVAMGGAGIHTGLSAWPGHAFHHHHRPLYAQQNMASVLASIEERLRALDALYSARFSPRLDHLGVDAHARRLDGIETRLGRLETLLELRLDKLTETVSSRQLKDELARDQLSRSMDATTERLHHRLGYMETRLDVTLTKVQTSLETLSGRVERLDPELGARSGHAEADYVAMDGVRSGLDELRKSMLSSQEVILNATRAASSTGERAMQRHFEQLSSALSNMQEELNRTLTVQNDGGGNGSGSGGGGEGGGSQGQLRHERHIAGNLLSAVERQASSFGSKVTNMYNELWRRTQVLEGLSKDTMALSNATRRELQEGLRSVSMQLNRFCSLQADKAKPGPANKENFEATIGEMNHKMGDYFQRVISTQNVLLATCHRTQENDPDFEKYLANVLERMLDIMSSNKCQNEIGEVHQLLKSHHSTVVRNVGHNTNTILRAANSSSKESRNLENIINEGHEGLLDTTKDIQKTITSMHEEQNNVQLALEEITVAITDLQDQLTLISNKSISSGIEDNEPEAFDITTLLKKKFEDNQRHISEEIHNLTHTIKTILQNIRLHHKPVPSSGTTLSSHHHESLGNNILTTIQHNLHNLNHHHSSTEAPKDLNHLDTSSISPRLHDQHDSIPTTPPLGNYLPTSTPHYSKPLSDKSSSLPELTINIIPEHEVKTNESKNYKLPTSNLRGQSNQSLEKSNDKKLNHNKKIDETFITIVHNDKPLTPDGKVTYSSRNYSSTREQHKEFNLQRNNTKILEQIDEQIPKDKSSEDFHTHFKKVDIPENLSEQQNKTLYELSETNQEHLKEKIDYENTSVSRHSSMGTDHTYSNDNSQKLPHNTSEHRVLNVHNKSSTKNKTNRQIETSDEDINNSPHSIYHLLNKLEELSNRLMNYESTEVSENDYSESKDDSQEDSLEESQEDSDYKESESTFPSN